MKNIILFLCALFILGCGCDTSSTQNTATQQEQSVDLDSWERVGTKRIAGKADDVYIICTMYRKSMQEDTGSVYVYWTICATYYHGYVQYATSPSVSITK